MKKNKNTDEWAKKAIPILKELGYINGKNTLYVFTAFVIGLTFSGVLFYMGWMGWLSDVVDQSVNVDPQVDVFSNTNNTYEFKPDNKFNPNYTIYVNNIIPDGFCGD